MMHSLLYRALVGGLIIVFAGANANATQPAHYTVSANYYINDTNTTSQINSVLASSGKFATISTCVVSTAMRTACASVYAAAGRLGSQSSMLDISPATIPGNAESSNGFASFTDVLTITGGTLSGTYRLVPTVTVQGTGSWNNVGLPETVGIGINENGPDGITLLKALFSDATQSSYSTTFQLDGISFQPGVPFDLALGFGEAARIFNGSPGSENTQVNGNFTMKLTGLVVLDSSGNPVSAFSIASTSGASYGKNGVVITFDGALADINSSLQSGLIDSQGIATSLSQHILAAENATGQTRANILNALINEINAQSGKHIAPLASQLLLQDARALIPPTTVTRTYTFPQAFNISLPVISPCCTFNWGITPLVFDPSLMGNATVTNVSVSGTATVHGQLIGGFDWIVLANPSSFGFPANGQVFVNSTNNPFSLSPSAAMQFHFAEGGLSGSPTTINGNFDFTTNTGGTPCCGVNNLKLMTSTPMTLTTGLYVQMLLYTGDPRTNIDVSNLQVTLELSYAPQTGP